METDKGDARTAGIYFLYRAFHSGVPFSNTNIRKMDDENFEEFEEYETSFDDTIQQSGEGYNVI